MAELFLSLLTFVFLKNLPISINLPKQAQKFVKYQTKTIPKNSQRLKILPKRRNFDKSSHTGPNSQTCMEYCHEYPTGQVQFSTPSIKESMVNVIRKF